MVSVDVKHQERKKNSTARLGPQCELIYNHSSPSLEPKGLVSKRCRAEFFSLRLGKADKYMHLLSLV